MWPGVCCVTAWGSPDSRLLGTWGGRRCCVFRRPWGVSGGLCEGPCGGCVVGHRGVGGRGPWGDGGCPPTAERGPWPTASERTGPRLLKPQEIGFYQQAARARRGLRREARPRRAQIDAHDRAAGKVQGDEWTSHGGGRGARVPRANHGRRGAVPHPRRSICRTCKAVPTRQAEPGARRNGRNTRSIGTRAGRGGWGAEQTGEDKANDVETDRNPNKRTSDRLTRERPLSASRACPSRCFK